MTRATAAATAVAKTRAGCLKKKPITRHPVPIATQDVRRLSWPSPISTMAAVAKNSAVISGRFSLKYCTERWLNPSSAAQTTIRSQPEPFVRVHAAIRVTAPRAESRVRTRPEILLGPTQRKISPWTHGANAP